MVKTIDSERLKTDLLRVQSWEDEGGQLVDVNGSSAAPLHVRRRVTSMRWNEKFVIEPFQPGNGTILISEKHAKQTNP